MLTKFNQFVVSYSTFPLKHELRLKLFSIHNFGSIFNLFKRIIYFRICTILIPQAPQRHVNVLHPMVISALFSKTVPEEN